jgi:glycosyltransferase involved in cell wall biosynthesis
MSKISILVIPPDKHGVGKYRALDPYTFIGDNYLEDFAIDINYEVPNNDAFFTNYDAVVFHTFIHQTTHEDNVNRIKWLKKNGIKVIMDIDDFWFVDPKHPMYFQITQNKVGEKKIELLKLSDYVTTTTSIFAETINKKLGIKDSLIFPNAVNEDEPQFKPNIIKSDKIRFGWLGGSSHLSDIELLKDGISITINDYKKNVQFVLCGFDTRGTVTEIERETGKSKVRKIRPNETVWYTYEKIFTNNYKWINDDYKNYLHMFNESPYNDENEPYRRRWTRDLNSYATNYNFFEVSLAPLVDKIFNNNKSQLKVIEAGFHKKALIASYVNPYKIDLISAVDEGKFNLKGNALIVPENKNHKEWAKHMKRLIENPNMIEDLGNRLYETVKDKYSLKKVCQDRVQFFKTIINKNN